MKLNYECFRAVLVEIEKKELDKYVTFSQLVEALPNFSEDDIYYSVLKLNEAKFIDANIIQRRKMASISCINDITFSGHEFLNNIKSDTLWNKTVAIAKNIGTTSVTALSEIAVNCVIDTIKNHL